MYMVGKDGKLAATLVVKILLPECTALDFHSCITKERRTQRPVLRSHGSQLPSRRLSDKRLPLRLPAASAPRGTAARHGSGARRADKGSSPGRARQYRNTGVGWRKRRWDPSALIAPVPDLIGYVQQ